VNQARGQSGKPEKEVPPMEAVGGRLMKAVTKDNSVCITVICRV
jgi:hypothetical protein